MAWEMLTIKAVLLSIAQGFTHVEKEGEMLGWDSHGNMKATVLFRKYSLRRWLY